MIDLAGIGNRILALPIPARNYVDLAVGKAGVLFLAEGPPVGRSTDNSAIPIRALWRFTTEKRETEQILGDLKDFKVSFDGEKLLYARGDSWFIASVAELKPGSPDAPQGNAGECWRHDGTVGCARDLEAVVSRDLAHSTGFFVRPALAWTGSRQDTCPVRALPRGSGRAQRVHLFVRGDARRNSRCGPHVRERPRATPPIFQSPVCWGADYTLDGDRYRFAKIYNGQNWTPGLSAPLTLPGINVFEGDYLLAVNGHELHASDNIGRFFDGTAGKQTVLRIAKSAQGAEARNGPSQPWCRVASEYEAAQSRLDRLESPQG